VDFQATQKVHGMLVRAPRVSTSCMTEVAGARGKMATSGDRPDKNLHAVMRQLLDEFQPDPSGDDSRARAVPAPTKIKAFAAAISEGRMVDV
jgi:hypothetical protein